LARKGLPKWAIAEARKRGAKNIFAYAWSLVKRKRSPKPKTKKRSVRTVAKKKRRYSRSLTIPLAPVAGMAVPFLNKGIHPDSPFNYALKGKWDRVAVGLISNLTGFNPDDSSFKFERIIPNVLPIVGGLLVHKFVGGSPLNLNRLLARARIPLVRI